VGKREFYTNLWLGASKKEEGGGGDGEGEGGEAKPLWKINWSCKI
jgi:hypothetical protein